MHDVCIIYSREDRQWPSALEKLLSPNWSVWWDKNITGDFRSAIETAIPAAKCVMPLWSAASRHSNIVFDEANLAKRNNIPLLPIFIEKNVTPPLGFGSIDTVDLFDWKGEPDHPEVLKLLDKLNLIVPAEAKRPKGFEIGDASIRSPTFFFSVSSHETRLSPLDAIQALTLFRAEAILVSAYDIFHAEDQAKFIRALKKCRANGTTILLDSGNYEASRKADNSWTPTLLKQVLKAAPHDFAFCFDELNPKGKPDTVTKRIIQAVEREARHTSKPVLPIVHARIDRNGQYDTRHVPYILTRLSETLRPPLIGIPERELGSGIISKVQTLANIRAKLNDASKYQPLHILGTGNPLSMAILTAVGGDCFDGLEWCRVVADASTCKLYHFQQYDFFSYQTSLAQSAVVRDAVNSDKINYTGKAIFHNLDFFSHFVSELRNATDDGKLIRFLSERLPVGSMAQLEAALPKVF